MPKESTTPIPTTINGKITAESDLKNNNKITAVIKTAKAKNNLNSPAILLETTVLI